jgi:hypothetical protein
MKLTGAAEMTAAPSEMRTAEACAPTVESTATTAEMATAKMRATASAATHMNATASATTTTTARTRIGLNRQCRQESKRDDSNLKKMSHGLRASNPDNRVQAY